MTRQQGQADLTTAPRRSLFERWDQLGKVRGKARSHFFTTLRRVAETDDARAITYELMQGLLDGRPVLPHGSEPALPPYPGLGHPRLDGRTSRRDDIVFITGRFRSGSTLLWNLFRNLPGCTAYYEPHNERRWFDPQSRGSHTDPSHRQVSDYWLEYEGLEELGHYYRKEWTERHFFMDESFWDPGLRRYTEILVERAAGRPVLQCNRIDFRLPWIRKNFPNAKIIHLFRHPRDQWISTLMGDASKLPRGASVAEFARFDRFYLIRWAADLKYHFPFLDPKSAEHPYQLYYYLWKLSYLFGRRYADYSLAFEHLIDSPAGLLSEVFRAIGMRDYDLSRLLPLIERPELGRWSGFADDDWFRRHEEVCETVLHEFFEPPATRT
jgi:hypothetical protein